MPCSGLRTPCAGWAPSPAGLCSRQGSALGASTSGRTEARCRFLVVRAAAETSLTFADAGEETQVAVKEQPTHAVQLLSREQVACERQMLCSPTASVAQRLCSISSQAISALSAGLHANTKNYLAFYSSELGGIVTDPALMVVSVDDHLVHRGHAVFDTAVLNEARPGVLLELYLQTSLEASERVAVCASL